MDEESNKKSPNFKQRTVTDNFIKFNFEDSTRDQNEIEKYIAKINKLESEPTEYKDDDNKLNYEENTNLFEINRIANEYSIDLDKAPQSFNQHREFIITSRSKLEK